ncbi:MAG: filamentous hemagglutinin N-terminal domain-containing protein [Cyanobacteria bacterium P01_G01_bin.38]
MTMTTPLKLPCLTLLALGVALQGRAIAQVIPDGTLGVESSQLFDVSAVEQLIRGGALRDENLFHSFEQFSIGDGGRVTFDNPAAVQRVFSRVTGDLPSEIFGTLGSTGTADVYFLNPNGIIFGPNARLNVGGSFVVSTADAFEFAGSGVYSARNPQLASSLLTILPSALQFGQILPGEISVQSTAENGGLQVPNGESLVLLGGPVTVDGGLLVAQGGRIEVGAAQQGIVQIASDGKLLFSTGSVLERVTFENGALAGVAHDNAGDIQITAQAIEILGSQLDAGIFAGSGNQNSQAGDIVLVATDSIRASGGFIYNAVNFNAVGRGGNIEIVTPVLELSNGAQIAAFVVGTGDVGSITINASESTTLTGEAEAGFVSGVYNQVTPGSNGRGGNIEVTTPTLEVLDGAQISASTFGMGDAGNITINASESSLFAGETRNGLAVSSASSAVQPGGVGSGGNVEIYTSVLEVLDGAQIGSGAFGQGDAGDVIINASESALFAGETRNGIDSGAFSSVEESGVGSGGTVEIVTSVLEVLDGARLSATTFGEGDAGSVDIRASESATFIGEGMDGASSGALSSVEESGIGNGGNVEIVTSVLQVLDGAQLLALTSGQGDAGNTIINTSETATFSGGGSNSSGAFTSIHENGVGSGGTIEITTSTLEVLNGAVLATDTGGRGDAGDITINASDSATFDGGIILTPGGVRFLSSATSLVRESGIGNGGDIEIITVTLELLDGATLLASTRGEGDAGDITIDSQRYVDLNQGEISTGSSSPAGRGSDIGITTPLLTLVNQSEISTQTVSTDGGNIILTLDNLLALTDNSTISTEAGTEGAGGNGGDITINTQFIATRPGENSDIVADAFDGDGGNVNVVATDGIFGIAPRPERTPFSDITASSRNGVSGDIAIQSPDVDPNASTTELPTALDAPDVIQSCREAYVQSGSEFVVTGRGGLPQGPLDSASTTLWQDVLPIESNAPVMSEPAALDFDETAVPVPIVEVQGWIKNEQGQIVLVAEDPQQATIGQPLACQG